MLYVTKPKQFQPQFDVVACYVECNGKFLMLQRHPEKPNGACWGLPAGKVNSDEGLLHAMQRELREETGIVCTSAELQPKNSLFVTHKQIDFMYYMFTVSFMRKPEVTVNQIEHTDSQWLSPIESLLINQVPDQADCTRLMYGL